MSTPKLVPLVGGKSYQYSCTVDLAQQYVRGIPGWSTKGNLIVVPRNMLPFFPDRHRPDLMAWATNWLAFDEATLKNGWKLRGYQHTGREYIDERRGTLLADAPRIGKTAQIVASHHLDDGQLFVVGPLMTRAVWLAWFKRMWGHTNARIVTLKGKKQNIELIKNADVVFVNYDILSSWQNMIAPPHTVVFDEAHLLSNNKTKRFKAAGLLADQAQKVICATGTPLWNKPANAYSILDLVEPGGFGSYWNFVRRYTNMQSNEFGWKAEGVKNEDELKMRLGEIMLRREWDDVAPNLPKMGRNIEVIELSPADRVQLDIELEAARDGYHSTIADIARMRRIFAMEHKVEATVHLAENYLNRSESVVIWTWHKDVAQDITNRLVGNDYYVELITGDTPRKDTVLETWRSYPCAALIISLGVGQTGIDLSHARHAIFAEIDFTPAVMSQAEMRTFSAERPMTVDYIVTDHPVEMAVVKGLLRKCKMAQKTGLPAADTDIEFLSQLFSAEELLLDELVGDENTDDLLTDLLDEAMDDGDVW